MTSQSPTDPAPTSPTSAAITEVGNDSTYQWTDDTCAMCKSHGPWAELEVTREETGDRWNVIHHRLHGTITPDHASRIKSNLDDVATLSEFRRSRVYTIEQTSVGKEDDTEDVKEWARASGLKYGDVVYSRVEDLTRLRQNGYSEPVLAEVQDRIKADQQAYERDLFSFVSGAMIRGELEEARSALGDSRLNKEDS